MVGHGRRARRHREAYEASLPKCESCGQTIWPEPTPPTRGEKIVAIVMLGACALAVIAVIAVAIFRNQ